MTLKNIIGSGRAATPREDHWIPLADLMTGLMMMFMLVAILFMVKVQSDAAKAKEVAVVYDRMRTELYKDLYREFKSDLPKWRAELDRDLTIRFREPDVLFDTGRDTLKPRFAAILSNFFPRYVRILASPKYRSSIEEIRVEGHTSSLWEGAASADDAYFKNMELSQARTRTTLQFVLSLPNVAPQKQWLQAHVTANGLSSSRPVLDASGLENRIASQRVEFRVRTDADRRIEDILQVSSQ